MTDPIERFDFGFRYDKPIAADDGEWVKFTDYESLSRQLDALKAEKEALEDNLRLARGYHQACERARKVESTRSLIRGTLRGFKAGENTDAKRWRERAEAAEQSRDEIREAVREYFKARNGFDVDALYDAEADLRALVPDPEKE